MACVEREDYHHLFIRLTAPLVVELQQIGGDYRIIPLVVPNVS